MAKPRINNALAETKATKNIVPGIARDGHLSAATLGWYERRIALRWP